MTVNRLLSSTNRQQSAAVVLVNYSSSSSCTSVSSWYSEVSVVMHSATKLAGAISVIVNLDKLLPLPVQYTCKYLREENVTLANVD